MISVSPSPLDLAAFRQQFPALANKTYFNYGGQGPMPRSALEAMQQAHQRSQEEGPFSGKVNRWIQEQSDLIRQLMASELGVPVATMTLTEDVTVGCNIPLWGVAWEPGDHILLSDCEHPGVVAAVQEICRRFGVEMSLCPLLNTLNGGAPVQVIADHLRPQTRMVVISHILWNTGQVLPLQAIAQLCHSQPRPVLVHVDAAQSVGALPLNLTELEIDFYAFTGHKWWCGPAGLGGLYVRPEAFEQIHPTYIGWRGITVDANAEPSGWKPNGQRFEIATSDFALLAGLEAAIATHTAWGTAQQRYERICQLSQYLWQRLGEVPGIQCLCQAPPESGLVSFYVLENGEPSPQRHRQFVETLEERGFLLRTLLAPNCIRACVHYFSLESEVDDLIRELESLLAK
ncbi:MAG TPA: aminotransferase class V-fold PLP-dependent enzyme [Leptolyngbyaceae cyanobacterium]